MIDNLLKAKETATFLVDNFMECHPDLSGFCKFVAVKGDEGIFIQEELAQQLKFDLSVVIFKVVCSHNIVIFTVI